MSTYPYLCRYLQSPGRPAQRTYHAVCLEDAVAMHNEAMPGHRDKVMDWMCPLPLGWTGLSSIPPQPLTSYSLPGEPGEPVRIRMALDTDSHPVPLGHELEMRYFVARDGTSLHVRWHALNGAVTEIRESEDLYGLHHWDTIGHDPFTCDDCPSLKDWSLPDE